MFGGGGDSPADRKKCCMNYGKVSVRPHSRIAGSSPISGIYSSRKYFSSNDIGSVMTIQIKVWFMFKTVRQRRRKLVNWFKLLLLVTTFISQPHIANKVWLIGLHILNTF